jgi:hypothetical protein
VDGALVEGACDGAAVDGAVEGAAVEGAAVLGAVVDPGATELGLLDGVGTVPEVKLSPAIS